MSLILGIESTAHTFGIGIVRDGKILCNVKDSYTTKKGGIIPLEAAKHHEQVQEKILKQALKNAKIKIEDIDAVAFSQSPGLAPCLIQGKKFAKYLAKKYAKPIIPVNHCIAHLEIGRITGAKDPVLLYASGANTQIIAYAAGKYRIFGETLDLGIGNFIDTIARKFGLGFPGGPKIQKIANQINNIKNSEKKEEHYIELPYTVKGMDMAFSGIQNNLIQKYKTKKYKIEDLAFSLQETIFAMLIEATERALAHTEKKELLLGGGVACNNQLQKMCRIMASERNPKIKVFIPDNSLLVDNGTMIAYLGEIMFKNKIFIKPFTKKFDKLDINPKLRTDDVNIKWKKT